MSYFHGRMINISVNQANVPSFGGDPREAYLYGHRDARHEAAEIALEADARIKELEQRILELGGE